MPRLAAGIERLNSGGLAFWAACSYVSSLSGGYGRVDEVLVVLGSVAALGGPCYVSRRPREVDQQRPTDKQIKGSYVKILQRLIKGKRVSAFLASHG